MIRSSMDVTDVTAIRPSFSVESAIAKVVLIQPNIYSQSAFVLSALEGGSN
jgi:hypothetical protein